MLSQIREAAARVVAEVQRDPGNSDYADLSMGELKQYLDTANFPYHVTTIDGGWFIDSQLAINPVMSTEYIQRNGYGPRDTVNPQDIFERQQKRMHLAAWVGFALAIETSGWNFRADGTIVLGRYSETRQDNQRVREVIRLFQAMAVNELPKVYLKQGLKLVQQRTEEMLRLSNKKSQPKKGLSLLLERKPAFTGMGEIEFQNAARSVFEKLPTNGLACRTWGFEMEIADAMGIGAPFGIEKGQDGSLRSYENTDDCDCSCDECYYHECDCEHCETGSSDPDHCNGSECSQADSAEFRTKNGINRVQHAGLHMLCKELSEAEAEVNDTCGVHIHVYAQDLQTKQVANVLAIYKWLENMMAGIAGRDDVNYAKRIPIEYIQQAYNNKLPVDKPRAVNLTHIAGRDFTYQRGTIEFRQMLGNYDEKLITVWAWMLRGLVEVCKRGAKLNDFLGVASFDDYIEVLGKFEYTLQDEKAGLLIPGGQQDNKYIERYAHERA